MSSTPSGPLRIIAVALLHGAIALAFVWGMTILTRWFAETYSNGAAIIMVFTVVPAIVAGAWGTATNWGEE